MIVLAEYHKSQDSTLFWAGRALSQAREAGYLEGEVHAGYLVMEAHSYIGGAEGIVSLGPSLIEKAYEFGDTLMTLKIINMLASFGYHQQHKYPEEIELLKEGIALGKNSRNYSKAMAIYYGNLANVYTSIGESEEKAALYNEVLTLAIANNDTFLIIEGLRNMGNGLFSEGQFDKALEQYRKVQAYLPFVNDPELKTNALDALGQILLELGQLDSAIMYFNQLIEIADENDSPFDRFYARFLLGKAYMKIEDYGRAISELEACRDYFSSIHDVSRESDVMAILCETYSLSGNHKKAVAIGEEALRKTQITDNLASQEKIISRLGLAYKRMGNYEKALMYFERHGELHDSIRTEEYRRNILNLETHYELKKKEYENADLKEQLTKDRTILRQQRIISLAVTFGLVIIGGFLWWNNWQKNRYNEELVRLIAMRTSELHQSNNNLQKLNEELQRFAYITSHDLKEPLRNIINYATLIESRKENLSSELGFYLDVVVSSVRRMDMLVEDVLKFSLLRQMDVKLEWVNVGKILDQVEEELKEKIRNKDARIMRIHTDKIRMNPTHLQLVFRNLIDNSLTYNNQRPAEIIITHREDEEFHYFTVKDKGIGIAPEFHSRIFEMFRRLHGREKYLGSGLGLAMCKFIVDYYQGEIIVKSAPGKGAEFTFSIAKDLAEVKRS